MPHSVSIQAPTSRVVRGSVSVIQAFSRSCCASLKRHALPSWPKLASPSIPSSSYSRCQVRIVSASSSKTLATAAQLIPSSNKTSAFARRARRCAADPSRASSIRSCRDAVSRKPGRIIRPVESGSGRLARGDADSQGVEVYQGRGGTKYNNFLLQPFVNYNFGEGWYVGTSPVITANWLATGDKAWTLPVGAQVGRVIKLGGKLPVNLLLGAYYNALRPAFGSTWQL